jgi:hypothetical protein
MLARAPDQLRDAADRKLTVIVKIPQWIAKDKDLLSRTMEGTLTRVTEKAVLFNGAALIRESRSCHRCGREITHPASLCVGYGPECSAKLGILWPEGLLSEEEIEKIRSSIRRQTQVEIWLPRSRTEIEIQRNQDHKIPNQEIAIHPEQDSQSQSTAAQDNSHQSMAAQDNSHQCMPRQTNPNQTNLNTVDGIVERMQVAQVKFEVRGARIVVECPFGLKERCKEVPGYAWDAQNKRWTFPATGTAAQGLVNAFDGVASIKDTSFLRLIQDEAKTSQAEDIKVQDDLPDVPKSKTRAWGHQRQAYWFTSKLWTGS